jgi:long-subunit acyl-CoA synthetase (AMP-forming)
VFSKLRQRLGGRVRIMSSGSAPISAEVLEFLRVCFGGVVFEGYGMTESACVIAKTAASDFTTGHVGAPAPSCEVKLVVRGAAGVLACCACVLRCAFAVCPCAHARALPCAGCA